MKKLKELLEKRWFANLTAICGGVLLYLFLKHFDELFAWIASIIKVFQPVIIGVVVAYLMDPIAVFFEKRVFSKLSDSKRRSLSVLMTTLLFLLVVIGAFGIILPAVIDSVRSLVAVMQDDTTIDNLVSSLNELGLDMHLNLSVLTSYLDQAVTYITDYIRQNASQILNTTINIGNTIVNVVIGLVIALYLLLGKKSIVESLSEFRLALLGEEKYKKHNVFLGRCHEILISYIGCDLLDSMIVGGVNAIVMMLLGMPYISLVSVIAGVTNLLPTFGPIFGAILGSFVLVFADPVYVIYFLILTVLLQVIDAYIIKPKLFGNSLGVPAVLTLASTIIFGKLYGVGGILLAIPLMAIMMFVYKEHFLPWLRKRNHRSAKSGA